MSEGKKKNLVIITSAIKCVTCYSKFSPDIRYLQIMRSILTTIEKIPDPYIVVLDTGTISDAQRELLGKYVDEVHCFNMEKLTKNGGELLMLYFYLNSQQFQAILPNCKTINKLSGRYYFTDRFDFDRFDMSKNIIRYRLKDTCPPYFDTRYYRIPVERFEKFWKRYYDFINNKPNEVSDCSVENVYHTEKFFEIEDCEHDTHLGVGGFFACSGVYQED